MACRHAFDPTWKEFNGGRCGDCALRWWRSAARPRRQPAPPKGIRLASGLLMWPIGAAAAQMREDPSSVPYIVHRKAGAILLRRSAAATQGLGILFGSRDLGSAFEVCLAAPGLGEPAHVDGPF